MREKTWYHFDISTTSAVWRTQAIRKGIQQQKSVKQINVTLRLSDDDAFEFWTLFLSERIAIIIWHMATQTKHSEWKLR